MQISKNYINERAIAAYKDSGGFILLEIGVGVGKTKTALDIIDFVNNMMPYKGIRSLYVCSTVTARDITVPDEIVKWDKRYLHVDLIQYEGLDKFNEQLFDIVIFDEAHNITQRRLSFFERNPCRSVVCMTGTVPDDREKMQMLTALTKGNHFKYSMQESTKNRTVNDVQINIIYAKMDPVEQGEYDKIANYAKYAYKTGEQWRINKSKGEYTRFISNCASKIRTAEWVIESLRAKGRRFLIYTHTKEQADALSQYRHYSGRSDSDLELFMKGTINELASIRTLKDSINIVGLTHAVITQLNSKYHNLEQIVGRLTRNDLDTIGKAYIICLRGTADEKWVKSAVRRLKNKVSEYVLTADMKLEQL